MDRLLIEKFHGAKRIDALEAFPLVYHPSREDLKKLLLQRGQKFRDMRDSHHVYYQGNAFFQEPDRLIRIPAKSRIMIGAGLFWKSNPSYPRLFTKKSDERLDSVEFFNRSAEFGTSQEQWRRARQDEGR
jgi:hypothetical protein